MLVIEVTEGTCLEHLHVILKILIFVQITLLHVHRNALIVAHTGTFSIQIVTGYPNSVLY